MPQTKKSAPVIDGLEAIQQQLSRLRLALDAYTDQALEYVAEGESDRASAVEQVRREVVDELQQHRMKLESERLRLAAQKAELERQADQLEAKRVQTHQRRSQAMQLRQARLDHLKALLSDEAMAMRRQAEALETQRKYAREVLAQREAVVELQRLLSDAEQRMIRRWGIQQAFGWAIRALICLAMLLGVSYFAGGQLSRQTWMASAVVRHLGSDAAPTPRWVEEQQKRLLETATLGRAAVQLRQSGYDGPAGPQDIAQTLRGGLHVHAPAPNLLHIELRGANREALTPVLNALVRAYAAHTVEPELSNTGEFIPRMHIVQDAKPAEKPIYDNRSQLTAMLFGGSLVATLLVLAFFAFLAVRSRRGDVAAIDSATVANEDTWKAYHDALERPTGAETQPLF